MSFLLHLPEVRGSTYAACKRWRSAMMIGTPLTG